MSTYTSLEPESCIHNLQYKYHSPVLINYGTSWGARSSTNSALKDTRTESHNSRCIVYSDYNFRSRTVRSVYYCEECLLLWGVSTTVRSVYYCEECLLERAPKVLAPSLFYVDTRIYQINKWELENEMLCSLIRKLTEFNVLRSYSFLN